MGMRAIGLTDHGTVSGVIAFLKACRKNKIKPIIGCESYLSRNHKIHNKADQPDERKGNKHLNIIAKNYKGFQNLCALSQIACVDGYYYSPRIDFELLNQYKEGIIVTSACLSSIVNWNLSKDRYEQAKKSVGLFKDIFGDDFYLEIMFHGLDSEAKILPDIQKLGLETNTKVIATNDCHYLNKEDSEFHEYIMCVSSGKTINDPKRIKFPYKEFYLKSKQEMLKIFGHVPSVMNNTLEIADKCDYSDLIFVQDGGEMKLPRFDIPKEFSSPHDFLENLGWNGLKKLGLDTSIQHVNRLKQELTDIRLIWDTKKYDFATYFLIVHDIMDFARKNGIGSNIRGSGVGSLLLLCLGVSETIDPIKFSLLWERFLGFSEQYFISEDDLGIKVLKNKEVANQSVASKTENQTKTDVSIMFDRYS